MAELTTTRSDMVHFFSLFMMFLVVVAASVILGTFSYVRHARCNELGYTLAQWVLPLNPSLDHNHDGEACDSLKYHD